MTGEITDGQHLIAKRRDQEQINFRKYACHFGGHFATETIGLYKIHR